MPYLKEEGKFFSFFGVDWGESEEEHKNKISTIAKEYGLADIDEKNILESIKTNIQKINKCIREKRYTEEQLGRETFECFYFNQNQLDNNIVDKKTIGINNFIQYDPREITDFFYEDTGTALFMLMGSYLSKRRESYLIEETGVPFETKTKETSWWCYDFRYVLQSKSDTMLDFLQRSTKIKGIEKISRYDYAWIKRFQKELEKEIEDKRECEPIKWYTSNGIENYHMLNALLGVKLTSVVFSYITNVFDSNSNWGNKKKKELFEACKPIIQALAKLKCFNTSIVIANKVFQYLEHQQYSLESIQGVATGIKSVTEEINKLYQNLVCYSWFGHKFYMSEEYKKEPVSTGKQEYEAKLKLYQNMFWNRYVEDNYYNTEYIKNDMFSYTDRYFNMNELEIMDSFKSPMDCFMYYLRMNNNNSEAAMREFMKYFENKKAADENENLKTKSARKNSKQGSITMNSSVAIPEVLYAKIHLEVILQKS